MRKIYFSLLFLFSLPLWSQDDFYIKDYFVDVKIQATGEFQVTELISVFFNEKRRGIQRDIPLQYKMSDKSSGQFLDRFFPHELIIDNINVKNFDFLPMSKGTGMRIRIGNPEIYLDGDQLYEISYTIKNGLLHQKTFTEFYWNLIGDYWSQEIQKSGFKISVPAGIEIQKPDVNVYTGIYGSKDQEVPIRITGQVIEGESSTSLGRNKGMTISVRLPPGIIEKYPAYLLWWKHVKFGLLPLFTIIGFIILWWKHGRDTRLAKVVAYLPPKNVDSALAGYAIDLKAHERDALSLIPYFGSKGFLKVEQLSSSEMNFTKLKDLSSDAPPYQKIFFEGLFGNQNMVSLSSLTNQFYTTLNQTIGSIKDSALHSDYFTSDSVKIYKYSIFIMVLLAIVNSVFCFYSGNFLFLGVSIIVSAVLILVAYILLKRSMSGDEIFKEVRGFKQFIELAEKDKLQFLLKEDPNYFDKTLPYAFAFSLTETWGKKFKGMTLQPPNWYSSYVPMYYGGGFNAMDFEKSMTSSLDEMRSVMSSQPSTDSSSWSGGGGGGFSGGGFGGGGGSSW